MEPTMNKIGRRIAFALTAILSLSGCIENKINKKVPIDDSFPVISVSPELVDFGYIDMGESSSQTVVISNIGNDDLEISDISLAINSAFTLTIPSPITVLAPGEDADFVVSYQALRESDTGKVYIENNDTTNANLEVPLIGRASYPALLIDPDPYIFNYAEIGDHMVGNIELQSIGQAPLVIDNVLLMGTGFTLEQPVLPITLNPEEVFPLTVYFDPTEEIRYEGTLWVSSNSPAGSQSSEIFGNVGSGNISGRLCDPSGEGWVIGATVYVSIDYNGDGIEDQRIQTTTDADGFFVLEGVPSGVHTVYAQKGSYSVSMEINFPGGNYEFEEEYCLDPTSVKIAVVAGEYDSIEHILSDLDLEYDMFGPATYRDLIYDSARMAEYDIIFFNCGMPFSWLESRSLVASNLANFVADGGSVYASDWAHLLIEAAWPDKIDFFGDDTLFPDPTTSLDLTDSAYVGRAINLHAEVLDEIMIMALGSAIADIGYDLDAWVVPMSVGSGASVMIRGDAPTWDITTGVPASTYNNVPLAVQFAPGGRVIYTTFHNELQMTMDMEIALKEIILSL